MQVFHKHRWCSLAVLGVSSWLLLALCHPEPLSCLPVARGLGLLVHLGHTPVGVAMGVLSDPWGLGAALGSQHLAFPLPALPSLL